MRFVVQLLAPAQIVAQTCGSDVITVDHIQCVAELFHDAKGSAKILHENASQFVYQ